IPVVIGKNYQKFPEAISLIDLGGVVSISNSNNCSKQLLELMQNEGLRNEKGNLNSAFITQNQGATEKTLTRLNKDLMSKSQFE
ncbi:MAG: 3-deoxy-D-manno-octulosonic acid transferase, partial [Flavobacteriales bacterium]